MAGARFRQAPLGKKGGRVLQIKEKSVPAFVPHKRNVFPCDHYGGGKKKVV